MDSTPLHQPAGFCSCVRGVPGHQRLHFTSPVRECVGNTRSTRTWCVSWALYALLFVPAAAVQQRLLSAPLTYRENQYSYNEINLTLMHAFECIRSQSVETLTTLIKFYSILHSLIHLSVYRFLFSLNKDSLIDSTFFFNYSFGTKIKSKSIWFKQFGHL